MFTAYTLDQLTLFLAVVDEGSFSAAGRRLGRVQSAVSYGIAQLEQGLETQLFDRSGRVPVLTDEGHRLAAEARLVLAQARQLTEAAARLHEGIEPELRVAIDALYPRTALTTACDAFARAFPGTMLRVRIGLLDDIAQAVLAGSVDLGVGNLAGGVDAQLESVYLGRVRLVPVCAASHALASLPPPHPTSILEKATQIVHSESVTTDTADQGVLGSRTWRVTELALKADLIRRGVGWGSLPTEVAEPWLDDGSLVRLHPQPWPPGGHEVGLHALSRRDLPLGRAGQWFREALAQA